MELVSLILNTFPFAALALYAVRLADYRWFLDAHLQYIPPKLPVAPEDVLGFGFGVTWLFLALCFGCACFLSYRFGTQRKTGYWLAAVAGFGWLSLADFWLYGVLERQVLAG